MMLHQTDTDVIFPPRVIPTLRNLRGVAWRQLIDRLSQHQDHTHPEVLAFTLMMIRQSNCLSCHPHCYRAMRGCTHCSHQIIARFKGSDEDLVNQWEEACRDIQQWLKSGEVAQAE